MKLLLTTLNTDLCLLAKMVDPLDLLALHHVAVRGLEYLGAFSRHSQEGD